MDRTEHVAIGIGVGVLLYLAYTRVANQQPTIGGLVGVGLLGGGAAILPDIIEPANNPHHRGTFHSVGAVGASLGLLKKVLESPTATPEQKLAVMVFFAGYGSHILLDSSTPAGIPLI